jgi:hypothetical protein
MKIIDSIGVESSVWYPVTEDEQTVIAFFRLPFEPENAKFLNGKHWFLGIFRAENGLFQAHMKLPGDLKAAQKWLQNSSLEEIPTYGSGIVDTIPDFAPREFESLKDIHRYFYTDFLFQKIRCELYVFKNNETSTYILTNASDARRFLLNSKKYQCIPLWYHFTGPYKTVQEYLDSE